MDVYPAIDLMDGEVVRLREGKKEKKKIYGSPLDFARLFSCHVEKVHIVDLDGAFTGEPRNLDSVREIIRETDLRVQLGGGLRSLTILEELKNVGVKNPIIGTKALDRQFVKDAADRIDGLTVSLDISDQGLAVKGWSKSTDLDYREAFQSLKTHVDRFVLTATTKDGKLGGVEEIKKFWDDQEVIYAGGVSSIQDLIRINNRGFDGAIIGKAIYEGKLDLSEATRRMGGKNAS